MKTRELNTDDLNALTASLGRQYYRKEASVLDPVALIAKRTEHNPEFWQEISTRIEGDHLILILVVFDTAYRAWEFGNPHQLQRVLSETTGYPFWVTDINLTFLIFMDDHDCVSWA